MKKDHPAKVTALVLAHLMTAPHAPAHHTLNLNVATLVEERIQSRIALKWVILEVL